MNGEAGYPAALSQIPLPPFGIYWRGARLENDNYLVAMVGTRKATPDGEDAAYAIAKNLAFQGVGIISGLAFGIDAAAHKGALSAGATIAVLATAVNEPTPATHRGLAEEILRKGGTLVSEYPIGSPALAHRFLERNRIVSGMARATVVVEAPERSGSLATARFALEQNREVFAVPGPAGHRNYSGSHALIREGARLATSADEILSDLGLSPRIVSPFEGTREEAAVLEVITRQSGAGFDEISETTKLESALIGRILNSLILAGKIKEGPGNYQII